MTPTPGIVAHIYFPETQMWMIIVGVIIFLVIIALWDRLKP